MALIVRSLFSQLFSRNEPSLRRHSTTARENLLETERYLSRQLKSYFRQHRRVA